MSAKKVEIFDKDQNKLNEYSFDEKLSASAVDTSNNNQFFGGFHDGRVEILSLATWRPFTDPKSISIDFAGDMTLYYHREETNEDKKEGEVCETPAVVDIGVYTKSSHRKFIVVYDNGEIHGFNDNGEWRYKWKSPREDEKVSKLIIGPKLESIVLTNHGFQILKTHKLIETTEFCANPNNTKYISAAFDAKFPDVLFFGSTNGSVFIHRNRGTRTCRPYRIIDIDEDQKVHVATDFGRLLVGTSKSLSAFNATSRRWKKVNKFAFQEKYIIEKADSDVAVNLEANTDGHGVTAIVYRQGNVLKILEGYTQNNRVESEDVGMSDVYHFVSGMGRVPIMVLIVALGLGYRWWSRKGRKDLDSLNRTMKTREFANAFGEPSQSYKTGRGGRGSDPNMPDDFPLHEMLNDFKGRNSALEKKLMDLKNS